MKLITIQNIAVKKQLDLTGFYIADFSRAAPNLVAPYHKMSDFYGWNTCPIFCGVVGEYAEFYGAKIENSIAFQLDVPDDLVRLQYYYDWVDLVYFTEIPGEFHDTYNPKIYPTLDSFASAVLDNASEGLNYAVQATIPYIKAEWITDTLADIAKLDKKHNGTGGANILNELQYYSSLEVKLMINTNELCKRIAEDLDRMYADGYNQDFSAEARELYLQQYNLLLSHFRYVGFDIICYDSGEHKVIPKSIIFISAQETSHFE